MSDYITGKNILIINPLLHIVVEEFVCTKSARLSCLNTINIDIVIITNLKFIQESKVEKLLLIYKNLWSKKNFFSDHTLAERKLGSLY